MSKACLVDITKCIGCRSCQVACKEWNQLPAEQTTLQGADVSYENPPALSSKTYTRISFHEIMDERGDLERSVFVKRQCMHCEDPACASACPVGALEKVKDGDGKGAVIYDSVKCMGCRYCMLACPFNIPTLQWDRLAPRIQKCTFCFDRLQSRPPTSAQVDGKSLAADSLKRFADGQRTPACAKACPTGAIKFGERDELITEARSRIAERKRIGGSWQYVDHIYGEKEAGGTGWLYLSNVPFEKIDFRVDLGERAYPEYTNLAMNAVPGAVIGIGAILGGFYWISRRRSEAEKART